MLQFLADSFRDLMQRGGLVMWPLLLLSLTSVTLVFERCWFYIRTNHPVRLRTVARILAHLRRGEPREARRLADRDPSVYGDVVQHLLAGPVNDAVVLEAVASQRRRLERFMPTLSTIITAAPMLGILGTVLGIISSFEILADQTTATDPRAVSQGIAEALITTAVGLVVAIITLFPYNALRAQVDRTLSHIEALAAAAMGGGGAAPDRDGPAV